MTSVNPIDVAIQRFVQERDEVLLSMDKERIIKFYGRWDIDMPLDDEVFWAGIHTAITGAKSIPIEKRRESKKWLTEHGFQSLDDGEL